MASPEELTFRIGAKLRDRRLTLKLTLDELASRTGMTKGHISAIERDTASPSVSSLLAICRELGVSVGSLFEEPESLLVRASERPPIEFGGEGIDDFLLTPLKGSRMQAILSRMQPGGSAGADLYSLQADEEFVFVLKGSVRIQINEEVVLLNEGDALKFNPRQPHNFANASDTSEAIALFFFVPPVV